MNAPVIPAPTLDKVIEVHPESQAIGEFLEWLENEGYTICQFREKSHEFIDGKKYYSPAGFFPSGNIQDFLHRYFKIDPRAEEQERRALLEAVRQQHLVADVWKGDEH